jgi:hypothetical protein
MTTYNRQIFVLIKLKTFGNIIYNIYAKRQKVKGDISERSTMHGRTNKSESITRYTKK